MSRESKVLIGVGALVVIGLILALIGQTTIGVIAVLIGLIVGVVALRVTKTDATDPFAEARTEADLHNTGTITGADPLAPWSPEGGLNAWTPPADLATPEAPQYELPAYEAPTYEPEAPAYEAPRYEDPQPVVEAEPAGTTSWDEGWDSTVSWAPDTESTVDTPDQHLPDRHVPDPRVSDPHLADAHLTESNPLDDLVGLDSLDPIAEVERIEGRSSMFDAPSDFQAPSVSGFDDIDIHGKAIINEQVSTADDIMAASQATELNLGASDEQTELQKLLAKVQIRLSAYE